MGSEMCIRDRIKAITEYENVRSELYGLLLQLEILSNTEIISKK